MKLAKGLAILSAIVSMHSANADSLACCVPISLDVIPKLVEPNKPALNVRLTNRGNERVIFRIGFGPWVPPGQIELVALRLPSGSPIINKQSAIMDPMPGDIGLEPGKFEEEEVLLDLVYPELAAEIRKGKDDLIVFWTYLLKTKDDKQSERLGGWVMFPKKSTDKAKN